MITTYGSHRKGWQALAHFILVSAIVAASVNCKCEPDPDKIDVSPDCPDGRKAASSIVIQYDLSKLNDIGVDKQVRISGNRDPGQHVCYQPGAKAAIDPAVEITGQGNGTQNVSNLQDGNWTVRVIVIAGASTPHPLQTAAAALPPGGSKTLQISASGSGILQAGFLP